MAEQPPKTEELASRQNDGLNVALHWIVGSTITYVEIEDVKQNTIDKIYTPEGVSPNEVFNHPFRYLEQSNVA